MVQSVNRGGSITYHGPGQLVGYPILRLSQYAPGPKAYVRMLEEVLISTLGLWEIEGFCIDKSPGVWVQSDRGDAKIASIGIRVDQGITQHGFALNIDLDLAPFALITPCGISECRTTSLAELLHSAISLDLVAEQVAEAFSALFNISWTRPEAEMMRPEVLDPRLPYLSMKEA
jgi:lipoate-protein ligase B